METGDGRARFSEQGFRGAAEAVASGVDVRMVEPQPLPRQGRAKGVKSSWCQSPASTSSWIWLSWPR